MIRARRRPAKLPLLLMLLAAAAAMPARIWIRFGPFESFSILDVIIIAGAAVLAVRAAVRAELDLGDPVTATLLSVPVGAALLSLLWTTDISQTIKTCLILGESLTGYFLVVALLGRKPPRVIVSFGALFLLLAVMVAMLSLLHVPGFSPNIPPGYAETPEYLDFVRSYYSRLSHPSLGLSNDFATVTSFFTLFLFGWFVVSGDRRSFWFAILGTVATLLTLSRGAIAALIVGASLFMMRLPIRKAILQGAMAVTLTAAAGSAFVMLNPSTREMIAGRASTANVLARVEMVGVVVNEIMAKPLFGHGAGVETALRGNAHDTYLEQVLYYGVPLGLLVDCALLGIAVRFFYWPSRHRRVRLLAAAIGSAVLVDLLIFAGETSFEATLVRVLFYSSIGLSVSLLRQYNSIGQRLRVEQVPVSGAASRGPRLSLSTPHEVRPCDQST